MLYSNNSNEQPGMVCKENDCFTAVYAHGLCGKHGGKPSCESGDCKARGVVKSEGVWYCIKHNPDKNCVSCSTNEKLTWSTKCKLCQPKCLEADCEIYAKVKGRCPKHQKKFVEAADGVEAAAPMQQLERQAASAANERAGWQAAANQRAEVQPATAAPKQRGGEKVPAAAAMQRAEERVAAEKPREPGVTAAAAAATQKLAVTQVHLGRAIVAAAERRQGSSCHCVTFWHTQGDRQERLGWCRSVGKAHE